jgi:hypothetical protein
LKNKEHCQILCHTLKPALYTLKSYFTLKKRRTLFFKKSLIVGHTLEARQHESYLFEKAFYIENTLYIEQYRERHTEAYRGIEREAYRGA